MTKNEPLVQVEVDLSEVEVDTIAAAAHSRGQTIHAFMQDTTRERAFPTRKRIVFIPADAIPAFPFFRPAGQGAM